MKLLMYFFLISTMVLLLACENYSSAISNKTTQEQPVVIANDSLAYQIIIIDQGFNLYLNTTAKPIGFYSQSYLENKNIFDVNTWNARVNNPFTYSPSIYENNITYNAHVNFGYDVNYKLFNYFQFAQRKYAMRL